MRAGAWGGSRGGLAMEGGVVLESMVESKGLRDPSSEGASLLGYYDVCWGERNFPSGRV